MLNGLLRGWGWGYGDLHPTRNTNILIVIAGIQCAISLYATRVDPVYLVFTDRMIETRYVVLIPF